MATFSDVRKRMQNQGRFGAVRERFSRAENPSPQPVESVVRRPQPRPQLSDVMEREGYRLPERLTISSEPTITPEELAAEITRRAESSPRSVTPTSPAQGQRLIDIPANFFEGAFDSIGFGMLENAQQRINNILTNAGAMSPEEAQAIERNREQRQGTNAYRAGQFAGYIPPGAAIERGVATAARPLIQNIPRAGQLAITGGAAGAIEAAAQEGADVAFRGESFDPLNVAIGGAAGGAIGAVTPAVGQGVQRLIRAFRPQQAAEVVEGATTAAPLALPEPRQRGNANRAVTPEVIQAGGRVEPIGLPGPNVAPPTSARIGRQTNPYRQRLEQFAESMQGATLPPGREREVFLEAWGRFARPDEPDLETVIELAYPTRANRVTPDLVSRARATQRMRQAAGVPMPVRTMDDRYQGGVMNAAAMPETIVGTSNPRPRTQTQPADEVAQLIEELSFPPQTHGRGGGNEMAELLDSIATVSPASPVARSAARRAAAPPSPAIVPRASVEQPEPAPAAEQDWFTKLFDNWGVGITPFGSRRGRNTLTTEGQIVDSPIRNTIRGAAANTRAAIRRTYHEFVDMNDPIKKISREAYDTSMDASRANQIANVIVSDKFVTPQGQVVGEGLKNIVRKVGRGNYNAFTDYLILRHARTRMARGERVYDEKLNMTPEKVQERINFLESRHPNFRQVGEEWDAYYRNIRNVYGVDEDLIPQSLADALENQNPNYAPMRRQFTNLERIRGANSYAARGMFSGQRAPLQEVSPTGSTRKIVDPVRSTVEQTGAWVNAAMRNRVMKSIVNKISEDPESMRHIAEIVQPPKGQPNLRQILETEGEEGYLEMLQEDFNKLFKQSRVDADNIVRAMVKGEPVYVKINDIEAAKALLGMGAEQANIALGIMNAFSNAIKQGATGALAPLFAVRGATMDVTQALTQAENPLQHAGYLLGSVFSAIADAIPGLNRIPGLRDMAQNFYRAGGGYSAALRSERGLRRSVGNMRLDPLLSPRTLARGAWNAVAAPYRLSLKVADIAENMNRIAAYNYKLRQLGEPTPENVREAMNYAREITVNYSRRGRQSRTLEAIVPYQNAAVQGMHRFVKAWKESPVKTSAMVGLGVLLPKAIEYARFHEDEDYNKLPAREVYRNIFISKNADGTFNKIPISPEYNALGAFMVDMLQSYRDGDPDAFKGTSDALVNAFTPPSISGLAQGATQGGGVEQSIWGVINSTSLGPILGAAGNQTFYGAPVESLRVTDRSPQFRYDERTSGVARWLGRQIGWSPMKIDYVLRSYGGDPARIILPFTSEMGAGLPKQTILKTFIADPVLTNTLTDDYYRAKDLLSQAFRDHQEAGQPLPSWFDQTLHRQLTSTAKGTVNERVSRLYTQKRAIQVDQNLTSVEKAQKLRDVQARINEIFVDINSRISEAGVPILNR